MTHEHLLLLNSFSQTGMHLHRTILEVRAARGHLRHVSASLYRHIGREAFTYLRVLGTRLLRPPRLWARTLSTSAVGELGLPRWPRLVRSRARSAWADRERLFAPGGRPGLAEKFIAAARAHDHDGYTVVEAAAALGVSVRHLHGVSMRALGYPPGVILDLARVMSVARAIRENDCRPAVVARTHHFCDQATMNRQFVRFTGVQPGTLRGSVLQGRREGFGERELT